MNFDQLNLQLEYVVIVMALVILYLLYYVYTKDTRYTKNIRSIASVVEDLNKEIFYLKKELAKADLDQQTKPLRMDDDEIYQEIERNVYDIVHPLSTALQQLESKLELLEGQIDHRVAQLENGVKQISLPTSLHSNDDEKIITLYKQGVTMETIAKELRLSQPEVEFVLKINKIK